MHNFYYMLCFSQLSRTKNPQWFLWLQDQMLKYLSSSRSYYFLHKLFIKIFLRLINLEFLHDIRKWYSFPISFMSQCLHSLSLYGTLLYRPVSTGNLCAEILSFVTA